MYSADYRSRSCVFFWRTLSFSSWETHLCSLRSESPRAASSSEDSTELFCPDILWLPLDVDCLDSVRWYPDPLPSLLLLELCLENWRANATISGFWRRVESGYPLLSELGAKVKHGLTTDCIAGSVVKSVRELNGVLLRWKDAVNNSWD